MFPVNTKNQDKLFGSDCVYVLLFPTERLRDTLIHELCHAAAWLINGVHDGHGRYWKYW